MKIKFKSLSRSDLVCFDEVGAENFNFLDDKYNIYYFNVRDFIFVSLRVIFYMFFSLSALNFRRRCFGFISVYQLACLKCLKPKIVFTLIDNSSQFHILSRLYKKAVFFAVQNGHRAKVTFDAMMTKIVKHPASYMSIPHFFCYSQTEVDLYTKYNQDVGHYYPIGSLKSDLAMNIIVRPKISTYDICLISQYPDPTLKKWSKLYQAILKSDEYLSRFLSMHPKLKFCIALRRSHAKEHIDYYKSLYGENVKMISEGNLSSYEACLSSKLVYTVCSTLGYEMLCLQKKVFYACFNDTLITGLPYDAEKDEVKSFLKFSVCQEANFEVFHSKLNNLITLTDKEYQNKAADFLRYISPRFDRRPSQVISDFIEARLK